VDYGKFLYEKNKFYKEQKKKQKIINVKEIKLRPSTDEQDYQVKLRNLVRFLEEGNKVKITMRFRGREMVHKEIGIKVLERIRRDLSKLMTVDFFPNKVEGRQICMIIMSKKNNNIILYSIIFKINDMFVSYFF